MKHEIIYLPISKLKPNPDNPRLIRDANFKRLVKSLKDCPQLFDARPCICSDRTGDLIVLGGNMRYLAAKELKYKDVPAIIMSGLTEDQEREIVIKDNGETFGEWDFNLLANWSDEPLTDWGVDLPEDWLAWDKGEPADAEPQIDRAEELNKTWGVKLGDLWQIGEHRLLCGDSTKKEDVGRVMGGERATCVFTDPPYGVSYSGLGQSTRHQTIENDDLKPEDLYTFLLSAFKEMPCAPGCNIFVCHADGRRGIRSAFENAFWDAGYISNTTIVWVKNVASMGWQDFRQAHEPILFGWLEGEGRVRVKDRALTTVWEVGREGNYLHPTTKPSELVSIAFNACSTEGSIVWDSFLGSGTTMIAAENTKRKCRGIEISPAYCAVILQRMTDAFPGIEIKKVK
jgi:DNA modification methylase